MSFTTSSPISVVTSNAPAPIDWGELQKQQLEIQGFIKSLDAKVIKTSFVLFDEEKFVLALRNNWKPASWQPGANYEDTQRAFIQLQQKVRSIAQILDPLQLNKKEDCTPEIRGFWHELITLRSLVNNVATFGLDQLCQNYHSHHKSPEASSLKKLGQETFTSIHTLFDNFSPKVLAHFPELKSDLDLEKFELKAHDYIRKRERLWESMRKVKWTSKEGVYIPMQLIIDTQTDLKETTTLNKLAIRNAACFINLPEKASALAAQGGAVSWEPLRPICEQGKVVFKKGITGTYERDLKHISDLCNVYYKLDNGRIVISMGAIDSPQKALQMAHVMQLINSKSPEKKRRWRLHQLNSFYSESDLMANVQAAVVGVGQHLQDLIPNATLVHINTAFNDATRDKNEDVKSFENINALGLVSIANYAIETIEELLKQAGLLEAKLTTEDSLIKQEAILKFSTLKAALFGGVGIAQSIPDLKAKVQQDSAQFHHGSKATSNPQMKNNDSWNDDALYSEESAPYDEEPSDWEEGILKEEIVEKEKLAKEQESMHFQSLSTAQKELQNELSTFNNGINEFLVFLRTIPDRDQHPDVSKAMLILEVFREILGAQMNPSKMPFSRCTQIELFLLLDRLLEMAVIISCYSGLDRTGSVVAFEDALSQIEKDLYRTHLATYKAERDGDKKAKVKSLRELFELIVNVDLNRITLFKIANEVLAENYTYPVLHDIKTIPTDDQKSPTSGSSLRDRIIDKINFEYTRPADVAAANRLKNTLYYLELIVVHLLGTQLEKTSYSCAVPGLKYHDDVHWIKKYFIANPHLVERLPQLIFTEGCAVQLVTYYEGWSGTTISLTQSAIDLISRLSQYRST